VIVVPELDLIAVVTGWNIYDKPEVDPKFILRRVLATIKQESRSHSPSF